MYPHQFWASLCISLFFLAIIVRLIQKGRLEIKYCWLWLGVGLTSVSIVVKYDWLLWISRIIGSSTATTTLFLFSNLLLLLMCLQLTLIVSSQRRKIRKLAQQIALSQEDR